MASPPSSPYAIADARPEHGPAIERLEFGALSDDVARLWDAVDMRSNEPSMVLVATHEGELRGFLTASTAWHGRSLSIWLGAVAVDARHRRRGIGRALIEELVARAAELGARSVRLRVDPQQAATIAFYREAGFRELSHIDSAQAGVEIVMRRRTSTARPDPS